MPDIPIDAGAILLAPYVWKTSGAGASARAEATMPGAYLKARIRSSTIGLIVDGSANVECPANAMPLI